MAQDFPIPAGYRELPAQGVIDVAGDTAAVADRLGGAPEDWCAIEVSDGNMNAVWRIDGPAASVIAKQALPYIRVIGESWPFPVSRIEYEHRALAVQAENVAGYLPEVFRYRPDLGLIFMQALTPHVVARHGLIEGHRYPRMAAQLGDYLARSLFLTSDLHLSTARKTAISDRFSGNAHLCETTQDVVFVGPYRAAPLNRLTPGQEGMAAAFRSDGPLKLAAAEMNHAFRSRAEALIHGDLHTGSLMVTETETRVIDPEWSFVGPMGFDIGAVLGNLLLCYFSQPGHATQADDRRAHAAWILDTVAAVWRGFEASFRDLCRTDGGGLLAADATDPELAEAFVRARLAAVFADSMGFAGAKMIRRILGISHVADFETIADVPMRAACEARALVLARRLLLDRAALAGPEDVAGMARGIAAAPPP